MPSASGMPQTSTPSTSKCMWLSTMHTTDMILFKSITIHSTFVTSYNIILQIKFFSLKFYCLTPCSLLHCPMYLIKHSGKLATITVLLWFLCETNNCNVECQCVWNIQLKRWPSFMVAIAYQHGRKQSSFLQWDSTCVKRSLEECVVRLLDAPLSLIYFEQTSRIF